ncbi:hypothetical protein [Comamonas thiooxydans]|uniref:hypothetical protein n=1 Tax=Comamonas thiooxydans TaxID=363952 RepID=UPI000B40FC85|nr:hypothetical protein [Comamonas thiooxydans]
MTDKPTVHVNACEWQAYADRFFNEMKDKQSAFFQARKLGIQLSIPAHVRSLIKTRYGSEGQKFLDMVDGHIDLSREKSKCCSAASLA